MGIQLLLVSIAALFVGPLTLRLAGERRGLLRFLDGLILVSVAGLVVGVFLPHAWEGIGAWSLPLFAGGLLLPTVAERLRKGVSDRVHSATVLAGVSALVLHAVTDGIGLAESGEHSGAALALAVILHRVPVGLAVWWLVRQTHGRVMAIAMLSAIAAATALGWGAGTLIQATAHGAFTALLVFVAGSLMHVLFHQHLPLYDGEREGRARIAEAAGGLLGLVAVVAASGLEQHAMHDGGWSGRFVHYALGTGPALLIGYLAAAALMLWFGDLSARWLTGRTRTGQVLRGVALGLPLPVCSCGVVPLYSSLVRAGAPTSAALAFLVATPELGIEAFLMSFPLLGAELTTVRLVAAFLLATTVGIVVGGLLPAQTVPGSGADAAAGSCCAADGRCDDSESKGLAAFGSALLSVAGDTAAWIIVGLAVAAAIPVGAAQAWAGTATPVLELVLAAVVGIPVYICASGATPLAAALLAAGLSPGAALTFLLSGPATNVTTFGVLSRFHGRRVALLFALCIVVVAVVLGALTNVVLAGWIAPAGPVAVHGAAPAWRVTAALLVGLLFLVVWFQLGPRRLIEQILGRPVFEADGHGHDHGHTSGDPAGASCCGQASAEPSCCGGTSA